MTTHVDFSWMQPENEFGLVAKLRGASMDLLTWASNQGAFDRILHRHGAIVFRDFQCDVDGFRAFAHHICPVYMNDDGGNAPRSRVDIGIYTSSELAPEVLLVQHHEKSFDSTWPMKILFYCDEPPVRGGETPLCSSRQFMRAIDPEILREFERRQGITYIRNFRRGTPFKGLAETFGTSDPAAVEAQCVRFGATVEWRSNEWLQIRQRQPVMRYHPVTAERVFFGTPHLWHRSSWIGLLPPSTSYTKDLVSKELPTDAPMHAVYGDGSEIEESVIRSIYDTYERHKVALPWKKGDVMLIDNLLASHGRNPFAGRRRILASLRQPFHEKSGFCKPQATEGSAT